LSRQGLRNEILFTKWRKPDWLIKWEKMTFDFFDKHYTPSITVHPEYCYHIGHITCKQCGKEYSWEDWGVPMTKQFRWAERHQYFTHKIERPDRVGRRLWITNELVNEWFDSRIEGEV